MKSTNIHKQISETLELCLSKLSDKLRNRFDPEDKHSLSLLQHYRSTVTLFQRWIKQASETLDDSIQGTKEQAQRTMKQTFATSNGKSSNGKSAKNEQPPTPYETFMNQEKNRFTKVTPQPSGLLATPASV